MNSILASSHAPTVRFKQDNYKPTETEEYQNLKTEAGEHLLTETGLMLNLGGTSDTLNVKSLKNKRKFIDGISTGENINILSH